jgi:hypothetical protein
MTNMTVSEVKGFLNDILQGERPMNMNYTEMEELLPNPSSLVVVLVDVVLLIVM